MASPLVTALSTVCLLAAALVPCVQGQSAIERSRLFRQNTPPVNLGVDANGTATAETESSSSDDDSFGAQKLLKTQERIRAFVVTGGVSVIYTDNVALTRRDTQDDIFAVVNAGLTWSPRLGPHLEASLGLHASLFRYDKIKAFDFTNVGLSAGLAWSPPSLRGVSLFGRYDFTELLNRDGDQILMDHTLTLGLQKAVSFGRSHGLVFGATTMVGVSDPSVQQRSQLGVFFGYHLQLTRKLGMDFVYRPAVYFYTDSGRVDFNQPLSWNLRHSFTDWAELNATISFGTNRSDRSAFDYIVLTTGAGAGLSIRF